MATIKFWSEMTKATTVDGEDKVMIGRNATGEAMYADFQYLINQAGMNSSDYIPVDGNTLPDGGEGNKVTFVGPGTYTQSGGDDVVVPENSLGIITWDGDEWSLSNYIELPQANNKLSIWESEGYEEGAQVIHSGKIYEAGENTDSSDVPGNSYKWFEVVGGLRETIKPEDTNFIHSGRNLFNSEESELGRLNENGDVDEHATRIVSNYIRVESGEDYTVQGVRDLAVYDVSKNTVLSETGVDPGIDFTFNTGSEGVFIRISTTGGQSENATLTKGSSSSSSEYYIVLDDKVKLKSQVVTPYETDFITTGKNKFVKRQSSPGFLNEEGDVEESTTRVTSGFIKAEPNTEYTLSGARGYAEYGIVKENINADTSLNLNDPFTFTTTEDTYFLKVSTTNGQVDNMQLETGASKTNTQEGELYLREDINVNADISVENTDFAFVGKNMFDKDDIELGMLDSNGEVITEETTRRVSKYIKIEGSEDYTVQGVRDLAVYDSRKVFISAENGITPTEPYSFTADSEARYIRISTTQGQVNNVQLEKGDTATSKEPYGLFLHKAFNIGEADSLPEYAIEAVNSARKKVLALNSNKRHLNFIFITDNHINRPGNTLVSERTMKRLANDMFVDFVISGGDMVEAEGTGFDEAIKQTEVFTNVFSNIDVPLYYIIGNHDKNDKADTSDRLTNVDLFNIYTLREKGKVVFNENDPYGNYYYIDLDEHNIRVLMANGYGTEGELTYYSQEQIDWIESEVFDLPADYKLIITTHVYNTGYSDMNNFRAMIDGWSDKDKLIMVLAGHQHKDLFDDSEGWNVIHTDCSLNKAEEQGTLDEICFDIVTIDQDSETIYCTRIGRGDDRSFTY